jgi:pyrroline-5-carboxylate reductase
MSDTVRVGFVGTGRMATALAGGLVSSGFCSSDSIVGSDVVSAAADAFSESTGGSVVGSNSEVAGCSDVIVLAIKPQQMSEVLGELAAVVTPDHLVVSIAAGITLSTLAEALGGSTRLVRVMPNTPCLVGISASAFAPGPAATDADADLVARLLETVGVALPVSEELIDAVTGLSGSGPAYIYEVIEGLVAGGVSCGLSRDVALQLAAQTVKGAAEMVLSTGESPEALRDAVASPGGTTIAGLAELERLGLRGVLVSAVEAATRRSRELGAE